MNPSDTLADRYRIVRVLGAGSSGTSYEALDVQTDTKVVVKELSLRAAGGWKSVDLFEREAETLARLEHPAIPRYRELVRLDVEGDRRLYLVRDLVPGKSLHALVEEGWRPGEDEARTIAAQLLYVLAYLAELAPPIVHRDVKPENVIYRPDGRVSLVDFGSVQHKDQSGSTIAGTYGYMAPEQFRGAATAASDLYGLGATVIYLLSGRAPSELAVRRMAMQFRAHVNASRGFAAWLERMVAPQVEDRFPSARAALRALRPASPKRWIVPAAIGALAVAGLGIGVRAMMAPAAPGDRPHSGHPWSGQDQVLRDAPVSCALPSLLPTLKACRSDTDCTMKEELLNCGGAIRYVGVNSTSVAKFETCEDAWAQSFLPPCRIAAWRETEDGKRVNGTDRPEVVCADAAEGGHCMTYTAGHEQVVSVPHPTLTPARPGNCPLPMPNDCSAPHVGCRSSACTCRQGQWACTPDCRGWGECGGAGPTGRPGCDPPYTFDADGHKHYKITCLP